MLYGGSTQLEVRFAANLKRTPPTGHVMLAGDVLTDGQHVLTLPEASDLHRRLGEALARLDVLIAANTPEREAA